jgi:S1-C subfamily serine protease
MMLVLALATTACGAVALSGPADAPEPEVDPGDRAVRLEIGGCGLAAGRTGSGVAVADGLILTVAHVVARADGVAAAVGDGPAAAADIVAVDLIRDLALLRVADNGVADIVFTTLDAGAPGTLVAAVSGAVLFEVEEAVRITTEEILGEARHQRVGYRLDGATTTGDSGAGAYDASGRLAGIVFATSVDEPTTWATASTEIEAFLATHRTATSPIGCDEAASRLALPG